MRRKEALPELLAPAGSFEALIAAVEAGADAVYVGGKNFGARAFAENFDIEELRRAVEYTHLNEVKLYVTVNTLVYDRELDSLSEYVKELYRVGIDAIITADLGVLREIKRACPKMPIHASTQMSIHNSLGAELAYGLGAQRVVVARELPLAELKSVIENSRAEVEYFLHGALCVCHSGQCLFSSLVGGRSGNRGECAQPCRLPYNGNKYPLSLCDLSLAGHIRELIESGVSSLKIEGRMKSPDYVYNVTKIYRRLLDEGRNIGKDENELLKSTFSRGGFTDKYFIGKKNDAMTGIRTEEDKERTKALQKGEFQIKRLALRAKMKIKRDHPAELKLFIKNTDTYAHIFGKLPEEAGTSPLTAEGVKSRLSKMGQTLFSLDGSDIELELDEGLNLPPSAINAMRREAVEGLLPPIRELDAPVTHFEKLRWKNERLNTALFLNGDTFDKFDNKSGFFDICFLPIEYFEKKQSISDGVGVYIPPVIFDSELERVKNLLKKARELGVKNALLTNLSNLPLSKEFGFEVIGDFRLNVSNSESARALIDMGISRFILHPELSLPMARDIGGGVIVYGRIPLMLTERCFIKENFGCDKCGKAALKDRKGASFPLLYEFGHRNLIMNSQFTYMGDKKEELEKSGIRFCHFIFSTENEKEINLAIDAYKKGYRLRDNEQIRRIGIK